jgi:hypothetical protein
MNPTQAKPSLLFAVVILLAVSLFGCASVPTEATSQNLEEWEAVQDALEEGELTTGDPDLDLTWQARARANVNLARAMHRANTGDSEDE